MIGDRPPVARSAPTSATGGGDTVRGNSTACALTLVERKIGLIGFALLQRATAALATQDSVRFFLGEPHPVQSITTDNDSEFHGFKDIEHRLDTKAYFAIPHHAWERGTNENTNALLRQYIPKAPSLAQLTQAQCDLLAAKLHAMA